MSINTIEISEVNVHPLKNKAADNPLAAFASVVLNNQFAVHSIRIMEGKFGLFIAFPSEYNKKEGKHYDYCFPVTKELRQLLSEKILSQYQMALVA